jgi:adenylate kinase family enzyme
VNLHDAADGLTLALMRLDALLHREILRLRARYQLSLDEFRGLYVSDEQVDALVDERGGEADSRIVAALTTRAEELAAAAAAAAAPAHRWPRLQATFALQPAEADVLLVALAPHLDPKYETLYAYLNNDVTRKLPTLDLALRVLGTEHPALEVRRALLAAGTLAREGLVLAAASRAFDAAPGLAGWLIGLPYDEPPLADILRTDAVRAWHVPEALAHLTDGAAAAWRDASGERPVLVLTGRAGSGRGTVAAHLATMLGKPLLRLDLAGVREPDARQPRAVRLCQRLEGALLFVEHADALWHADGTARGDARAWLEAFRSSGEPVVLALGAETPWREWLAGLRVRPIEVGTPALGERVAAWRHALGDAGLDADADVGAVEALAERFTLTPGQIATAAREAADAPGTVADVPERLFAAARAQSSHALARLAQHVNTPHGWDDLVLPESTAERLREIAAAIRQRARVYEEWGFARRLGAAQGIKVLFAGPSGTGKTMAAAVVARDLGLDLYRIDLSAVVSKYIGETEKNLDRIFRAAAASDAILFFDEADALFGKRSEVKDAHDRYANIEVAYLLQKLEEHPGPVILASNLARNIDDAFARRMHYVVELPLPDERHRERLWRGMFPRETPLAPDVDFAFLAKQFRLAGGDIRNVVLDAAFLAAQSGGPVGMREIVRALTRQLAKQGRAAGPAELKQYHGLGGRDVRSDG